MTSELPELTEEHIEEWKSIIKSVKELVQKIAYTDASQIDGSKCSPEAIHAIIHLNQARVQIEHAIEALRTRIDWK